MRDDGPNVDAVKGITRSVNIAADLQPKRTTFRLTNDCTSDLSKLAGWMGISEKEVLDQYAVSLTDPNAAELGEFFTDYVKKTVDQSPLGTRRTRVISKRTRDIVERLANETGISRDWIVECIVRVAVAIVDLDRREKLADLSAARSEAEELAGIACEKLSTIHELTKNTDVQICIFDGAFGDLVSQIEEERRKYESLDFELFGANKANGARTETSATLAKGRK